MAGNRSAAGNPPAHSPAHCRSIGSLVSRSAGRSVGVRAAMQHDGGGGRLAGEKFAGAPSPQKKRI